MYSLALASERPSASTVRSAVAISGEAGPHGLELEIGVEVRMSHLAPYPRCLEAAEGRRGVARAPDVDVDRARPQQLRELVCVADVAGPHARREPVFGRV